MRLTIPPVSVNQMSPLTARSSAGAARAEAVGVDVVVQAPDHAAVADGLLERLRPSCVSFEPSSTSAATIRQPLAVLAQRQVVLRRALGVVAGRLAAVVGLVPGQVVAHPRIARAELDELALEALAPTAACGPAAGRASGRSRAARARPRRARRAGRRRARRARRRMSQRVIGRRRSARRLMPSGSKRLVGEHLRVLLADADQRTGGRPRRRREAPATAARPPGPTLTAGRCPRRSTAGEQQQSSTSGSAPGLQSLCAQCPGRSPPCRPRARRPPRRRAACGPRAGVKW